MGDYFNLDRIISLILLIFPFTAWIFGLATRLSQKKYVAAILRLFFGFWLIWIIEIVLTIGNGCNVKLLDLVNF
jgi:hypothetical protein